MNKKNKELLSKVIETKLQESMSDDEKVRSESFDAAMKAIDRQIELDKNCKDRIIKCVEIGAAIIATPLIEAGIRKAFAKTICEFEKDYTFTTSAGKSLSKLFKF